jgi:1,4-alpha-glucan branching enzyme
MLLDPLLMERFMAGLYRSLDLAEREMTRTKSSADFHALACMYRRNLQTVYDAFVKRYGKNLVSVFRRLQETGKVEILASAATHGYLPLLAADPGAVRAQVQVGIETYKHLFGKPPNGFWLPECGYAPGIDDVLAEYDIGYAVLETHGITRAHRTPRYGIYAPIRCSSQVAMFGRDPETSRQVWSAKEGYPGDNDYRDFYRDIGYDLSWEYLKPFMHPAGIRTDTGFKYYRVTGKNGDKAVYDPDRAVRKAEIHAADFLSNRQVKTEYLHTVMDRAPLFVAPYDAELFGHWWYEGPQWLNLLIRRVASQQGPLKLITLSQYLDQYPENQEATPCAGSWGAKGYHETWLNEKNDWVYPQLHKGALTMEQLASRYPRARGLKSRALQQAARELLLAQASDWAFMMHTGPMAEYGRRRTTDHVDRLNRIAFGVNHNTLDKAWLSEVESRDSIFPHMDYRIFCASSALPYPESGSAEEETD